MDALRLSVSKSKTYLDCQKKYKFSYVLKLPQKEYEYHTFGKFCHKILEDFHNFYINGSTESKSTNMNIAFKSAIEEFKPKLTKDMISEGHEIIAKYLKILSTQPNHNLSIPVLSCEKQFEIDIDGKVVLNGMIDRVQLDNDGILHVGDYKTSKSKDSLKKDFFQLLTYAYVLWSEDNSIKKVRGSYIMLRHNFEYITTEFDIDEILSAREKYLEYAKKIAEEQEFKANPTFLCNYCCFQDLCEEGQKKKKITYGKINWE